jgi:hypothetical protein
LGSVDNTDGTFNNFFIPILFNLSIVTLQLELFEDSLKHCTNCMSYIKDDPDKLILLLLRRSKIYSNFNHIKEAKMDLEKVLEIKKDNETALERF